MLRLGTDTHSLTNLLMSTGAQPDPEVGMGATELMATDRHAYTITRVSEDGKTIWIVQDCAKRVDNNGMSESQEYEYTPGGGREIEVHLKKRGWVRTDMKTPNIMVGARMEYYDFSY